jgi:hypothetical protein
VVTFSQNSFNSSNFNKTALKFFSEVSLDLSENIRSLDFLLLFGQAKSKRKKENGSGHNY